MTDVRSTGSQGPESIILKVVYLWEARINEMFKVHFCNLPLITVCHGLFAAQMN